MKKKITAVLLACVLAAGLTAAPAGTVTALAEEEPAQKTEDGFSYRVNGEEITITRYSGTAAKVVIPESIDGTGDWRKCFFEMQQSDQRRNPGRRNIYWEYGFSGMRQPDRYSYSGQRNEHRRIRIQQV